MTESVQSSESRDKSELLPCPFCGGEAELRLKPKDKHYRDCYFVKCKRCRVETDWAPKKELAELDWYRRVSPPGLAWTKTPPTEKDNGKWFLYRYIKENGFINIGTFMVYEEKQKKYWQEKWLASLMLLNAEFLGPLPE